MNFFVDIPCFDFKPGDAFVFKRSKAMDLYYIFDAPDGSENDHVLHIEQNNCIIYLGRGNDEDVEQANKIIEENSKPVGFMMNNKNSETYKFIYNNTMIWLQIDLRDEYYTRKEIKEFWFYFDKL